MREARGPTWHHAAALDFRIGANDREADEILYYGGEGVRSLFLFGLASTFLGVARINSFANVLQPAPRLVAGLFECEGTIEAKGAAGRVQATGKAGDEDELLRPVSETRTPKPGTMLSICS